MKRLLALSITAAAAGTLGYHAGSINHRGAQAHVATASPSPSQVATAPAPASTPSAPPVADDANHIRGRVVDDRGRPVAGAMVVARPGDAQVVVASSPADSPVDPAKEGVLTDPDGRFTLLDLPPGRYVLVAIHGHHSPGRSGPVIVVRGGLDLQVEIALSSEVIRA